jgi:hypothetical protein
MNTKRSIATILSLSAVLVPVLVTGCSQPAAPSANGAAGGQPAAANTHEPITASTVQTETQKIQSDPNTTPAEKQMMLRELQHAPTSSTN